jgi:hypothetical protein
VRALRRRPRLEIRASRASAERLSPRIETDACLLCQLKAREASQKYKEGKFIMESAVVEDDWAEHAWGHR